MTQELKMRDQIWQKILPLLYCSGNSKGLRAVELKYIFKYMYFQMTKYILICLISQNITLGGFKGDGTQAKFCLAFCGLWF